MDPAITEKHESPRSFNWSQNQRRPGLSSEAQVSAEVIWAWTGTASTSSIIHNSSASLGNNAGIARTDNLHNSIKRTTCGYAASVNQD